MDVDRHIEERKEIRQRRAAYWMMISVSRKGDQTGEGSLLDTDRHIEERKEIRQGRAACRTLVGISRKDRRSERGGQPIGC